MVTWGSPGVRPVFVEFSTFVGLLGNHWFAIQISPFTSEPFLHEVKLITCFAVTKGFSAHLIIYPHSHTTVVKIRRVHITCAWQPPDCVGGELAPKCQVFKPQALVICVPCPNWNSPGCSETLASFLKEHWAGGGSKDRKTKERLCGLIWDWAMNVCLHVEKEKPGLFFHLHREHNRK